ncbi:MAG: T9SS type A sorting domain-containing protein [Bacteroidetes bacterium]|nr:T9SS type A sorting domain-containing protein [Bacteroidota bacterium]
MYFTKTAFASGINEKAITSLGLYPNPSNTSSTLNFYANQSQPMAISVKDFTGRQILSEQISTNEGFNEYTINTSILNNGTYLVQVQSNEGITTQKLMVNR